MIKKVNKFSIILIFITLFFIGCIENNQEHSDETQDGNINNDFDVIQYSIETFDSGIPWDSNDETSLGEGFIHNESADYYLIKGTIRNNLNENKSIEVTIDFYNIQKQYLDSYSFELFNIESRNFRSFSIRINSYNYDNFSEFDSVMFQIRNI